MTADLPQGWCLVTAADAGAIQLGRQRSPKNHNGSNMKSYLRVANVFEDHIDASDLMQMHFEPDEFERYRLHDGDVLLNEGQSPELLGRPAIYRGVPADVAFTNSLIRFKAHEGVLPEWALTVFRHHMHSGRFAQESRITTNIAHLSAKRFSTTEFPVPPTAEQQRITDELERRLSHLEAGEAAIRRACRLVRMARTSVLVTGTNGGIGLPTGDDARSLCNDNEVPFEDDPSRDSIVWVRLGDIAKVGSGTTPARGNQRYWENGDVPWVTSGQVSAGVINEPAALVTRAALDETSLKLWPAGTILMAMYGEGRTRGRCAELRLDSTCNQACAAIHLSAAFEPFRRFILLFLQGRYDEHRRLGGGGVQENLNLGLVRDIRIPLPGVTTQAIWAAEIERRMSLIDEALRTAEVSLQRVTQLRRTLLAAAFSGQLVPQDPADEPADALLDRIRATRAEAEPPRKTRSKRTKETAA